MCVFVGTAKPSPACIHTVSDGDRYDSPTPLFAPRCTEAKHRMEQSCVWWQWHPSHAMNNQWTPSGAYNRGAQHQSFTPRWLCLPPSESLTCTTFPHILICPSSNSFSELIVSSSVSMPYPPLHLRGPCGSIVMVFFIHILLYYSQAPNKMTCCPSKATRFNDLYLENSVKALRLDTPKDITLKRVFTKSTKSFMFNPQCFTLHLYCGLRLHALLLVSPVWGDYAHLDPNCIYY